LPLGGDVPHRRRLLPRVVARSEGAVLGRGQRRLHAQAPPGNAAVILTPDQFLFLLRGFGWTIVLSLLAFAGGGVLGFVLALIRVYAAPPLRMLAMLYIKLIQGTPLLILLFLTYFGLPALGLVLEPIIAAAIGLSTYVSAYLGEIWRGSLEAVPRTQEEAA